MKKIAVCILLSLCPAISQAWSAAASATLRSYPFGAALEATLKEDWMWWDERTEKDYWKFGHTQAGVSLATHGATEAYLAVYPISFVRVIFGLGGTYRFYESRSFDCSSLNCGGFLTKNRIGIRAVIPVGGDFLVFPEFNYAAVSHPDKSKNFVDETELLSGQLGNEILDTSGIFLGRSITKVHTAGFYLKNARYRYSGSQNEMMLLVFRADWKTSSLNFGLGRYQSNHHASGFTLAIDYETKWGEGLALF